MSPSVPWHARLVLLRPRRIAEHARRLHDAGFIPVLPTLWQFELGVLRMWHRVLFRSQSIGTSASLPVRRTLRARLFRFRPLRAPFLFALRAIAPLDHSGLAQPPERLVRHLLAAFHDRTGFAYDLEILRGTDGAIEDLRRRAADVIAERSAFSRLLRDLVVYEGYHESLLEAVDGVLAGADPPVPPGERDDPDVSFQAYVRWCAAQPPGPRSTLAAWRAGAFPAPPLPASESPCRR